jgi:hypothetical protein
MLLEREHAAGAGCVAWFPQRASGLTGGDVLMARRWSQLLVDTIDPLLEDGPFQAGQTGEPTPDDVPGWSPHSGASVIWCGDYDEVMTASPHLARPHTEPEQTWCFDVTVEIDELGCLSEVELEHGPRWEQFQELGHAEDTADAVALVGRPAAAAVPTLAVLLARLFTSGRL